MSEPLRTLLIEDNAADAALLIEILGEGRSRIEIVHCHTMAEALPKLRAGGCDVVLLDLSLPDARGVESVARVREAAPHLPVVVLTGLDDEATALRAMQSGAQDYLVKGQVDAALLSRALRYAIERTRAEESARGLFLEQTRRVQAEQAEKRATFLAEAGRQLASVLDIDEVPSRLADVCVPQLGDYCMIDVVTEGGALQRVAAGGGERGAAALADVDAERLDAEHPARRALRTREPVLIPAIDAAQLDTMSVDAAHRALLESLAPRSLMTLPLVAHGRMIGAMTLMSTQQGRVYDAKDLAVAWALADRAALALDSARLLRAREEMLSIVSHDLRNPLNVITVGVSSLRRGVSPERRDVFLEKIRRAAERMNRLIEDLLDVSRLESGNLPLEREPHPTTPILAEVSELLRPLAEEKSIRLVTEAADALPPIFADRERILQVLGNLVGNALKFTPKGGQIRIAARAHPTRSEVLFTVADTGPGIGPDDHARIFDRYYQAKRTDRQGGSGLGLAIAKGIVLAHEGSIWVESELGGGATFCFGLPVASGVTEVESVAAP